VIYGVMPEVKISTFDTNCTKTADLAEPEKARNKLIYDPTGRILAIGGFGSLSGSVDFWDISGQQVRKIGSVIAFTTSYHEWSPDGKHFLAAVVSPRMRQDNCVKIYTFNGELVYNESVEELFMVHWRPFPLGQFPPPPITLPSSSASSTGTPGSVSPEKPKVYRHPNFTGSSSSSSTKPTQTAAPTKYTPPSHSGNRVPVGGKLVGDSPAQNNNAGRGGKGGGKGKGRGGKAGGGKGKGGDITDIGSFEITTVTSLSDPAPTATSSTTSTASTASTSTTTSPASPSANTDEEASQDPEKKEKESKKETARN